jgi:hypothetical protein
MSNVVSTNDRREQSRAYYLANAEKLKEKSRLYRESPCNRERIAETNREYRNRPDVKARISEAAKQYNSREDVAIRRAARDAKRIGNPDELMKRKIRDARRYEVNWAREKLKRLRKSALVRGLDFDLDESDIQLPDKCPVFGTPFSRTVQKFGYTSPSVDRIDNTKGYVKGNVVVVSMKANAMKQDATLDDLKHLVAFYETLIEEDPND